MRKNVLHDVVRLHASVGGRPRQAQCAKRSMPHAVHVFLVVSMFSLLVALSWPDMFPAAQAATVKLSGIAGQRMGEYLFFIGTTHLSLFLLMEKKWIRAALLFATGIVWVILHEPVTHFVENLGGDSFSEAQAFDVDEAVFWLQTLRATISPQFNWTILLCYTAAALATYHALRMLLQRGKRTRRYDARVTPLVAAVMIGIALQQTVSEPLALFIKNTRAYEETRKNFSHPAPALLPGGGGVDLLVYIGESTSAMNMGIYGYPRDTTPGLQKLKHTDSNLLVFDNVFSTHTHTSPSLLEALSFAVVEGDAFLPINKRRRLSMVDLLEANRIRTTLVSNQGQSGTWNMASSIIFQRARAIYSSDTRKVGNNDHKIPKPWDNVFFSQKIGAAFDGADNQARIAFFHSYAGHGGYLDNIPAPYRKPVDHRFDAAQGTLPAGIAMPFRERVEEYDAAIRYIDRSVSRAIDYVRASTRPTVFVYFSDHGDAPFAGRAHDSSQFIHEMARVPFVIYFNDAARARFPHTYEKYRSLAASGNDATLAQLPSTLLDLLGRRIHPAGRGMLVETGVIGEKTEHAPIVVRETAAGVSYVNINRAATRSASARVLHAVDRSDPASRIYAAVRNKTNGASRVCYRAITSMAKLMRSRLVADCIQVAVTVRGGAGLSVSGPDGHDAGISLDDVFDVAARNRMGVWIHAPGMHARAPCEALARYLGGHAPSSIPLLVEFPTGSHRNAAELGGCAERLADMGVATSYPLPDADAVACARSLGEGSAFGGKRSCVRLRNDVEAAWRSKLYTDIGFDHGAVRAMEALREAGYFRWNTWHMKPEQYSGATSDRFKMTILGADE